MIKPLKLDCTNTDYRECNVTINIFNRMYGLTAGNMIWQQNGKNGSMVQYGIVWQNKKSDKIKDFYA